MTMKIDGALTGGVAPVCDVWTPHRELIPQASVPLIEDQPQTTGEDSWSREASPARVDGGWDPKGRCNTGVYELQQYQAMSRVLLYKVEKVTNPRL